MNEAAFVNKAITPVRQLYAALIAVDSENGVHDNLLNMEHSDYATMFGDPEPRFVEWAYHRLETRSLVTGLLGTVLRPSDARHLALNVGCDVKKLEGLSAGMVLREALLALGVHEPAVPRPILDGVKELERCCEALDNAINNIQPAVLEDSPVDSPPPAAELGRKGAERLLKVLCFFLWDNGFKDLIRRVVSEGLQGCRRATVATNDWEMWLHSRDLGYFNYLLKAISDEIQITGVRVPFLRLGERVWAESVFKSIDSMADALQTAVHDTQTTARFEPDPKRRMLKLFKAIEKVLLKISTVPAPIWRPRTIQFFRRVDDGYSIHHEGYDETGEIVRFLESPTHYDLHVPYLFVAATNPSAVNVSCTMLREEFTHTV